MKKYYYKVYFYLKGQKWRYVVNILVEANSNKEAVVKGQEKWNSRVKKQQDLQQATIAKITCRKFETEPRQPKLSPLQKAIAMLNTYINEDLSK